MTVALEARGLRFGYDPGRPVLAGVDLAVRAGEVVVVIGPNGAGKTTLLNLLAANRPPESGEVTLLGDPVAGLPARERARRLALVPQEPTVAFPFSVLEIVLMGRSPYLGRWALEGRDDRSIAEEALAMTGLEGLGDRRFHELSGGERQRVMVAKALAQRSKVLLLDEPTAFLDLRHQVEIYEIVGRLTRERGLAVLAVSHDINLAAAHSDRMALLSEGRIRAEGDPRSVLDPDVLGEVYGVEIGVASHGEADRPPLIFPLRSRRVAGEEKH